MWEGDSECDVSTCFDRRPGEREWRLQSLAQCSQTKDTSVRETLQKIWPDTVDNFANEFGRSPTLAKRSARPAPFWRRSKNAANHILNLDAESNRTTAEIFTA